MLTVSSVVLGCQVPGGGGNARTLTFLVVKNPEGISILVSEELTNNHIRILLYQAVISKTS